MSTHHYLQSYIFGLGLSLALTASAYALVAYHLLNGPTAIATLAMLALSQFVVQVVFFLHLEGEPASRERLFVLSFALVVVVILVGGSLWIMTNLNGRMMPNDSQMTQYMNSQQGI